MKTKTKFYLKTVTSILAVAATIATASAQQKNQDELEKAIRLTKLQGLELMSQDGKEIAIVEDIVFSPESGQINSLVVGTGTLGIGGPDKKIKLDRLEKRKVTDTAVRTRLSSSELQKSPDFNYEELEKQQQSTGKNDSIQTGPMAALHYRGNQVEDADGTNRGEVHDWIIDVNDGRVPFVVVRQLKPFAAANDYDYFAVSIDNVVGQRDNELIIDVSGEEFLDAESLDEPALHSVGDQNAVYQFRYDPSAVFGSK